MSEREGEQALAQAMCGECREPHMYRGKHDALRWGACPAHEEAARWLLASPWLAAYAEQVREEVLGPVRALAEEWLDDRGRTPNAIVWHHDLATRLTAVLPGRPRGVGDRES